MLASCRPTKAPLANNRTWKRTVSTYQRTTHGAHNLAGGSTFCGVAALTLMGKQDQGIVNKDKLIRWCLSRQTTGFAGRPNKDADACYCFWIGAALTVSVPAGS